MGNVFVANGTLRSAANNLLCPQSPRAKFLRNFSRRSAKNAAKFWRNFSQIFVLQFPGKMAAKNFTKNPRHFPWCTKLSFFTAATLGALGPNNLGEIPQKIGAPKSLVLKSFLGEGTLWDLSLPVSLPHALGYACIRRQVGDGLGGGRNGRLRGAPTFGQNPVK